jgi:hypothetical protein
MYSTVDSRRSRMVTFRVTMEEYHSLEAACMARRVRSISELARAAVQQWVGEASLSNPLDSELQEIERRIQALAKELERLQHVVRLQKTMSLSETTAQ